jgi:hypothetical protein
LLIVPELSEIEVAARDEQPVQEPFLLQYGNGEAPARPPKILAYESPGVRMVPNDANAAQQPIDCDQYAT